jgi:hypothetical protein
MGSRTRAAVVAVLLAVAGCNGGPRFLSPQYEYEEDLTLRLDGSATLVVNASVPALVALRGASLPLDPRARVDRAVREFYSSPYAEVQRVSQWTRRGRRFVAVRMRVPDIRTLPKAAAFSGERYDLQLRGNLQVFRQYLSGAPAKTPTVPGIEWNGSETVAYRLHLPSRIEYHNARGVHRGNILTWEQPLKDRLAGRPIAWSEGAVNVMEVRMDNQSILYRTLWLFALAFLAAITVLASLIWLTMRKGRGSEDVSSALSGPASQTPLRTEKVSSRRP